MLNLTAETMDEAADEIMRKALTFGTDHEEKGAFEAARAIFNALIPDADAEPINEMTIWVGDNVVNTDTMKQAGGKV